MPRMKTFILDGTFIQDFSAKMRHTDNRTFRHESPFGSPRSHAPFSFLITVWVRKSLFAFKVGGANENMMLQQQQLQFLLSVLNQHIGCAVDF